jgi:hypothetical protein
MGTGFIWYQIHSKGLNLEVFPKEFILGTTVALYFLKTLTSE